MTIQLRNTILIFIAWIISFSYGLGQNANTINKDSLKNISMVEFDKLVDTSISLLQKKELADISGDQHVAIIMCLNTIFMTRDAELKRRFTVGQYKKLEILEEETNYSMSLSKLFTNRIPNRGMGYFYPDLQMELYGTPRLYAWYQVEE